MSEREIITVPDPVLRRKSAPVERVDDELNGLADDMLETMYAAPGIGLAAVQLGILRRIVVADVAGEDAERAPHVLFNPRIVWQADAGNVYSEGCLSLPEQYIEVERPARCRIEYVDRSGKQTAIAPDGLLATCLQHEIDHLDGVLMIDYLSKLKRDMIIRKMSKAKRDQDVA